MIKDVMERNVINEISTLFVMIFTSGLMFVMPILDVGYNDIIVIIGFGILLSFMLTIIPILLSCRIKFRDIKQLPILVLIMIGYLSSWQFCHYDKPPSAEAFLSIMMLM